MNLGHDAEFAVMDKEGRAQPAHKFFPPKDAPIYTGYGNGGGVPGYHRDQIFRDGTSLEVNTPGYLTCIGYLMDATLNSLKKAQARLPAGMRLEAISAYRIDPKDLKDAPADVLNSGCSPVRNAYLGWDEKAIYMDPDSEWRYAGGHIHMSAKGTAMQTALKDEKTRAGFCEYVVRHLDLYLAVPIIYLGVEGENGARRRKIYGKAGEYRFQTYSAPTGEEDPYGKPKPPNPPLGIEYRVLGPEWLRDIGLAGLTLQLARHVTKRSIGKFGKKRKGVGGSILREAIGAINEANTKEIFESAAYQRRFKKMLVGSTIRGDMTKKMPTDYYFYPSPTGQVGTKHFEFMRANHERLFDRLRLEEFPKDGHMNWPQRLVAWGWGEEKK